VSEQRGQAIVGVLVIMTLIFVLAGAVAIGTTTLLTRLRGPATAVENDLTVRSAAAAAAATALNGACPLWTPAQAQQTVAPTRIVTFDLPPPNGSRASAQHAYCVAMQQAFGTVTPQRIQASSCTTTRISNPASSNTSLWIFFAAQWRRSGGTYSGGAYMTSASGPCRSLPPPKPLCSALVWNAADPVIPLTMSCAIPPGGASLFVYGATATFTAYLASQDKAGSCYLAVASTGLAHGPFEQVLLFQAASAGSRPELRLEGPLP
jgi:hypothetical protein